MPYAFGVDGGASHSRAVLTTLQGEVLHIAKGPGVNYHEAGAQSVTTTLTRLFNECLKESRARADECRGLCFGLAGMGRDSDRSIMVPLLNNQFGQDAYVVLTDAEVALAGGTLADQGLLVMAGTGSMIYGKNSEGKSARVGGYGPILSDEGSGYRIGQEALRAAVRQYDGYDDATVLSEWIVEHFSLRRFDELIGWVNSSACTREKIASLAPLVIRAADGDDAVAEDILYRQADALAVGVHVLHEKLDMPDVVDIVMSGGLLNHSSHYWQIVRRKILYLIAGANVIVPKMEPMLGAVLFALAESGTAIDEDIIQTLKRSFIEWNQKAAEKKASNNLSEETTDPSKPFEEVSQS